MLSKALLLSLAVAASAVQPKGFVSKRGMLTGSFLEPQSLVVKRDCSSTEQECGGSCIALTDVCCDDDVGTYCDGLLDYCVPEGCCPDGEICSGEPECDSDEELCGSSCIPDSSTCCDETLGYYCDSGTVCQDTIFCTVDDGSSSSDSSDDSSDSSDDSSDSTDDSSTAGDDNQCSSRRRPGGGGGGGGDDGECDAAGMLAIPKFVVGVVALLPLLL